MPPTSSSTGGALRTLLSEVFYGGLKPSWFLNPGDPGLIDLCCDLTADEASARPSLDRQTIAAHVRHLVYHLQLIARTLGGDETAFETADWSDAWKHPHVDEAEWSRLRTELAQLAEEWINSSPFVPLENPIALTGSLGSAVHFGYHLGAIRQILLQVRGNSTQLSSR